MNIGDSPPRLSAERHLGCVRERVSHVAEHRAAARGQPGAAVPTPGAFASAIVSACREYFVPPFLR